MSAQNSEQIVGTAVALIPGSLLPSWQKARLKVGDHTEESNITKNQVTGIPETREQNNGGKENERNHSRQFPTIERE